MQLAGVAHVQTSEPEPAKPAPEMGGELKPPLVATDSQLEELVYMAHPPGVKPTIFSHPARNYKSPIGDCKILRPGAARTIEYAST